MARQRLTVQETADRLGASVDAVRKRIARGSLASEKDADGRVYVWLDFDQPERQVEGSELVEELRRQNEYLREQLDQERQARTEERRRHDTLMAQLMQRIPELEAPQSSEDAPQESPQEPVGEEEQEPVSRPWWRRWLGG